MAKQKTLAEEVIKFVSYVDALMSRSLRVQDALGKTGTKMLARLVEMADAEIGSQVAPTPSNPFEEYNDGKAT